MSPRQHTIAQWCLRLFLTSVLLASAVGKSLDLPGFVEVLRTYRALPDWGLWPIGFTVTGLEWALGVWILSGRRLQRAALAVLVLNAAYAAWQTITLLRVLDLPNCGCFGRFFPQPLRWYSPLEDLVLVGMCWLLRQLTERHVAPH